MQKEQHVQRYGRRQENNTESAILIFLGLTSDFQITQVCNWMLNQDSTLVSRSSSLPNVSSFPRKDGISSGLAKEDGEISNICFATLISSPSSSILKSWHRTAQIWYMFVCVKEWFCWKECQYAVDPFFYLEEPISSLHEPRGSSRRQIEELQLCLQLAGRRQFYIHI